MKKSTKIFLNILGDELWYRAICMKTASKPNESNLMVYFLDWGIDYLVNMKDICKMPKDFIYLPATAHKCYIEGNINTESKN